MNLVEERILITGAAGFLGRALCRHLREKGCRNLFTPRSSDLDLRDRQAVARAFAAWRPTVVIHLAARVGGIGANRANPGLFFHDNLLMGLNLIEQARVSGLRKFVQLGTVCAYPKFTPVPFREEALWEGYPEETNAPYGIAKKALLVMLQAYRAQYGLCGIYLLPANLYGPGDNFDLETGHVIPALLRRFDDAARGGASRVTLWGDGTPTREFLYVDDAARGIALAGERHEGGEPVNLGTGREVSIRDLAAMCAGLTGFRGEIGWDSGRPGGQLRRCLDTSRAKGFGFEARVPLEQGLGLTLAWWRRERARA
jgi:GDP-L-fucose synthase